MISPSERYIQQCKEAARLRKEKEAMSKPPNNIIAHVINDPIKVGNYNDSCSTRLDQMEPHWLRSTDSTTYTNIGLEQSITPTSGYVQKVEPTPLIDNYEAYKLIEVLTEILDEVRSINKKLSKRKKK